MLCSITQQNSFEQQPRLKQSNSNKQQNSTQNDSSIRTIEDDLESNHRVKIKNIRNEKQKELIQTLLQKIHMIQKSQNQAKQKYEKCIFTLEKEISTKEAQNRKIEGEIHCLSTQIKQGKKDLQIISNYLKKQIKKNENKIKQNSDQVKVNSSTNILKKSTQKKHINNSPLRLLKKTSFG